MSDLGDIAISKNCQSYPNWHESIFEDEIFCNTIFKNYFFQKFSKKDWKKNRKKSFFVKKILKKIFQKNIFKKISQIFWKKFIGGKKYFILQNFRKLFVRKCFQIASEKGPHKSPNGDGDQWRIWLKKLEGRHCPKFGKKFSSTPQKCPFRHFAPKLLMSEPHIQPPIGYFWGHAPLISVPDGDDRSLSWDAANSCKIAIPIGWRDIIY